MKKYGISRYEEFIQKYNSNLNIIHDIPDKKEVCILDETGLDLDESMEFEVLNNLKIIDIQYSLFNHIEVILDCENSPCNIKYISLVFEDIMYYKGDFIYSGNIDFIYLKKGFRFEIKEKKKSKKMHQVNYFEVEAQFLTIKRVDKIILRKKKNFINDDNLIKKMQKKWNISYEKAYEASISNLAYIQEGLLLCNNDKKYNNIIKHMNISDDLKYFIYDINFIDCSIIDYGKTYNEDEFYLRLDIDDTNYISDKNGNIKYNYSLVQIKFIGVISIDIDDMVCGYVNSMYEKIHYDNSYELGLRVNNKFMTIHARDLIIEVLA